jgi:hypothetical protein
MSCRPARRAGFMSPIDLAPYGVAKSGIGHRGRTGTRSGSSERSSWERGAHHYGPFLAEGSPARAAHTGEQYLAPGACLLRLRP